MYTKGWEDILGSAIEAGSSVATAVLKPTSNITPVYSTSPTGAGASPSSALLPGISNTWLIAGAAILIGYLIFSGR